MTLVDSNAIREIERLVEAANPVIEPHAERGYAYYLRTPEGLTRIEIPLRRRGFEVKDLTSLHLAKTQHATDALAYYISDDKVTLVCEAKTVTTTQKQLATRGRTIDIEPEREEKPANYRYMVQLPLPTHPAFDLVEQWKDSVFFSQKDLVRLLRTKLRGNVDHSTIAQLENIKTSSSEEVSSQQTHAQAGLSRSVQREARMGDGTALLPEFTVKVPVYDVPEYRDGLYHINVIVDYDHERQMFLLTAVNDDLKSARELAVDKVRQDLSSEEGFPVYYGSF